MCTGRHICWGVFRESQCVQIFNISSRQRRRRYARFARRSVRSPPSHHACWHCLVWGGLNCVFDLAAAFSGLPP